jgi:hypothetical protein
MGNRSDACDRSLALRVATETLTQQFEALLELRERVRRAEARLKGLRAHQRFSRRQPKVQVHLLLCHSWQVH